MEKENPQVFTKAVQDSVDANYAKIMEGDGTEFFNRALPQRLKVIVEAYAPMKEKYFALMDVSHKMSKRIAPNSACTKGCHHCCHMAVTITGFEAEMLGSIIGVKPKEVSLDDVLKETFEETQDSLISEWMGVDCVFMKDGKCSIYAYRPFACRNYFNISNDATLCDLTIGRQDVPSIDIRMFWGVSSLSFGETGLGDIRQYFPDGLNGEKY